MLKHDLGSVQTPLVDGFADVETKSAHTTVDLPIRRVIYYPATTSDHRRMLVVLTLVVKMLFVKLLVVLIVRVAKSCLWESGLHGEGPHSSTATWSRLAQSLK